ncbi:MAG: cytochrome P450 [Roseiflexaceae bacterium]
MTKTIPQSDGLPFLKHTFDMSVRPIETMVRMQTAYPDIVEMHFPGNASMYYVSNPELIEGVLVAKQKSFQKDAFLKEYASPVFGNGLLSSDGEFWLRQRRMAQPAFHRQRIEAYGHIIAEHTKNFLASIVPGSAFNLTKAMNQLTLQIVAETLFGQVSETHKHNISDALDAVMDQFSSDGLGLLSQLTKIPFTKARNQRYQEATKTLDETIIAIIQERMQSSAEQHDLLGMFLAARDDDNQPMSIRQLSDECKTMFLAGHETTALTMTWMMWVLLQHPQVLHKLQVEVRDVLGARTATMADMAQLTYTEQVIREAMRLYPPAYTISRHAVEPVEIGGYQISAHKDVVMSQFAMHRDARWYPNPNAFIPERWTADFRAGLPKYAYFPFGGGPRLCIGQQFALLEATIILTKMMQHGSWALPGWQRIHAQPSITLRPKPAVMIKLIHKGTAADDSSSSLPHHIDYDDSNGDGGGDGGD